MTDVDALPAGAVRLHANRHVTVRLDDGTTVALRPPTVSQWRVIVGAYLEAEREISGRVALGWSLQRAVYGFDVAARSLDDSEDAEAVEDVSAGAVVQPESAPNSVAFARTLREVSSVAALDPDGLPMWTANASLFQVLYQHWRQVEVIGPDEPVDDAEGGAVAGVPWAADAEGDAIPVFDLDAARAVPEPAAAGVRAGGPGLT